MAKSTANAAELTAEQVKALLIQPLEDKSVVMASGVRIFDGNGSPVRLPKMGPPTSPGWHRQNELIGEVDPEFDELMLLPESLKSLKTITRYSNELARQSIIALDAAIKARLVKDVADSMDAAFIAGDGDFASGNQTTPIGLLNMDGTSEVPNVGAITLDDLHDAEGVALAADVNPESLKWLMRSDVFVSLRKKKATGTGEYLVQPDVTQSGAYRLLGHPVKVTNRLPKDTDGESAVVLWDPSQVAVARDVMPSIKVLDQTFAQFDQQALRCVSRADIGALNSEAVVILRGVTA